jgi:protein farnesyltransferase subunit beta
MNEGGFQGRTYKLVDACYSFWQGSVFSLLDSTLLNSLKYLQTDEELEEGIDVVIMLIEAKNIKYS